MSEFSKLLQNLKARYKTFRLVYSNDFSIPQIAVLDNLKILAAFKTVNILNRKKMVSLDESLLTFKALNGLMTNPQLDLKMLSYWNDNDEVVGTTTAALRKKIVAICRFRNRSGSCVYKAIRKSVFEDIVKNATEHREAFNGIERIYSFLPLDLSPKNISNFHFYEVRYSQEAKNVFPCFQILKCNFELTDLSTKSQENEVDSKNMNAPLYYESKAGNINERIRVFCTSIAREISSNFKCHVKGMQLSIVFDPNEVLWLLNAENIQLLNEKKIEVSFDKAEKYLHGSEGRDFSKRIRCAGLYCNNKDSFNHALIDEKDDSNNFYVLHSSFFKFQ